METTGGSRPTAPQVAGYRVEELVGFGGCGEVWRARDVATGRLVALKQLRNAGPPAERDRLRREAAVLAGLSSPHIVRLVTVVTAAQGLVLVLDFQGGGSLASLLRTRPRLAPGEVVTIAAPLAAALAEVHAAGLVHGDISPANVLFAVDGRPVLSDLGVARLAGRAGAEAVTAAYADPAVLDGAPLTTAADVYALAAVCFEALTGRPPHLGDDAEAVLLSAEQPRPLLLELAPDTPPALADVLELALAPDAAHRPDATELAGALLESCTASPVRLTGATVPVTSPATTHVRRLPLPPAEVVEPGPGRVRRLLATVRRVRVTPRRLVAAAAVPTAVAAAIWGGVAWARSSTSSRPAAWAAPVPAATSYPTHVVQGGPGPSRSATASAAAASAPLPSPSASSASAAGDPSPSAQMAGAAVLSPSRPSVTATAAVTSSRPAGEVDSNLLPVVTALDARRDGAFVAGDPTRLEQVYAPGSAPLIADQAQLFAMVQAGERASGLSLKVHSLRVVSRSATSATVTVADELPSYELVSAQGRILHRLPARGLVRWSMRLVRRDSGWLIEAISRA